MTLRALPLATLLFVSLPLAAQSPSDFETVLLPISGLNYASGAFGSVWKTEFTAMAVGNEVVFLQTAPCMACPQFIHVAPGFPLQASPGGLPGDPPGALLYPSRVTVQNAWFELRIRDLSREADDWGTELPVVRERNFFTDQLVLVDIPVDPRFRQALRIYDVDSRPDSIFRVSITGLDGTMVAQRDFRVHSPTPAPPIFPAVPSVVELTDLREAFPEITTSNRVAVTVVPFKTATRFWAFVSITNNTTQHVTTITPQH